MPTINLTAAFVEKVKANGQAIAAYQRYLAIAPGAGDSAAIRDRIDKLKAP